MKIEHGTFMFESAEFQAFDTPSAEARVNKLLCEQIETHKERIRQLQIIIEDDRRLMRLASQTTCPNILSDLRNQMGERTRV